MEEHGFKKEDWKLFRDRSPDWQEAYMAKLNSEYIDLLTAEGNASNKFWALEKRIKEDKRSPGVILEMSKSKFIWNLIALLNEGVITRADLTDFSDELQETVGYLFREETCK